MATYTITTDDARCFKHLMAVQDLYQMQFGQSEYDWWVDDKMVLFIIETVRDSADIWSDSLGCDESLRYARSLVQKLEQLQQERAMRRLDKE